MNTKLLTAESVSQEQLNYVRSKFLESVVEGNESEYDLVDIERVRTHDWTVQRYILDRDYNLDDAIQGLKETMKWRKLNDVNNIRATDFPAEFFQSSELFIYEPDQSGHVTGYVRSKLHRKFNEWQKLEERYVLFFFEQIEKKARERNFPVTANQDQSADSLGGSQAPLVDEKWIFVWDCDSSTIFNCNIELIKMFITTLLYHYPVGCYAIYVHQLPFILWAIYQMAKGMCPEKYVHIIHFTDKKSIVDIIGAQNLPDFYEGGKCLKKYRLVWTGETVDNIQTYAEKHGIEQKALDKFMNHYKKFLEY